MRFDSIPIFLHVNSIQSILSFFFFVAAVVSHIHVHLVHRCRHSNEDEGNGYIVFFLYFLWRPEQKQANDSLCSAACSLFPSLRPHPFHSFLLVMKDHNDGIMASDQIILRECSLSSRLIESDERIQWQDSCPQHQQCPILILPSVPFRSFPSHSFGCQKDWSIGYALVPRIPVLLYCGVQTIQVALYPVSLSLSLSLSLTLFPGIVMIRMMRCRGKHSMETVRVKVEGNSVTGIDSRLFCGGEDHVEQTATQYSDPRQRAAKEQKGRRGDVLTGVCYTSLIT